MDRKLHLGCGRTILPGWVNLDVVAMPGVDIIANLDECATTPLPFNDDSFVSFFASHLIEHIRHPLPLMQELHRIAKPGATAIFRLPYGSSDDAYEDPTHVRQYFLQSFGYFSQPYYWRADYGFRGDWLTEKITLYVDRKRYGDKSIDEVLNDIMKYRNVVTEMVAELKAVKPIRESRKDLQIAPRIEIAYTG
ncbi:class I SAM-dependent methyltransferase [Paenibacillus mesophilus]|uniref:class I SAM-dependent methyltransferase n=1 Tax=Paenibacillus mesophilus TaxID=2582849 RepID=UPI00110E4AED|nr:methyltransferase domain-containing protein [Paenibacillus mesophilus]TMV48365.1 class I SAM-dependent methyltransferase [Paenibacillus mesophilus]